MSLQISDPRPRSGEEQPPRFESVRRSVWSDVEFLWVGGLALTCVLLFSAALRDGLHVYGKVYDLALYSVIGTIFPTAILVAPALARFTKTLSLLGRVVQLLLVTCVLLLPIYLLLMSNSTYLLGVSVIQVSMATVYIRRERSSLWSLSRWVLICTGLAFTGWLAAVPVLFWMPYNSWIFGSDLAFLVFILSLTLVIVGVVSSRMPEHTSTTSEQAPNGAIMNFIAVLVLAMASASTYPSFVQLPSKFHHWGVYIGPAELVRQGGWLLWDVPSQYGFLNSLAISFFPLASVWESFYVLNSVTLFLSACFVFAVLRMLRAGIANFLFSLAVAVTAVFLLGGWAPGLWSPDVAPSVGAYRFIWCYALLSILLLDLRTHSTDRWKRYIPLAGCAVWLFGTFWSSESAVYCAAIWLPAYILIVLRRRWAHGEPAPWKQLRGALGWLVLPPLLVLSTVVGVSAYYTARLGHMPDWHAFFDYSISFTDGFRPVTVNPSGPVWTLFLVLCALSIIAARLLRQGIRHPALPLVVGSWGALWAVSSYYIAESTPENVSRLSPVICAVIGVALYVLVQYPLGKSLSVVVRMSFVPILTVLLTMGFGNPAALSSDVLSPQTGYLGNTEQELPVVDPSLLRLLHAAQVKTTDPVIYYEGVAGGSDPGRNLLPAWPVDDAAGKHLVTATRAWLPTVPFALFVPLPSDRSQLYMKRFIDRTRLSGWLVQRKSQPYTEVPWFASQLLREYRPTKTFEDGDWQVIWFQLKSASGGQGS